MLKKEKESGLEQEIDIENLKKIVEEISEASEEKLENIPLSEFMSAQKFSSPILEKVKGLPETADLEQETESFSEIQKNEDKQEKVMEYKTISQDYESIEQERRKIEDQHFVIERPKPILETRRIAHREIAQNFQINPDLQELRKRQTGETEKDYVATAEKLKDNSGLPFEKRETKYKGRTFR